MSDTGKTHLVITWTVGPDLVDEADEIFRSHAEWMKSHPREGATALLSYRISKGPELASPFDPASAPTGNTMYVLDEVYGSPEGLAEHWRQAAETWPDLGRILEWGAKGSVVTQHGGTIVHSLW